MGGWTNLRARRGATATGRIIGAVIALTSLLAALGVTAAGAQAAAPLVLGLSPTTGPVAGGATVTLYGQGFASGSTSVSFGGTAATHVTVLSESELTAVAPANTAGTVEVTATTPAGTSATSAADRFVYAPEAPSALTVRAAGLNQIALGWNAPSTPGVTGYTVWRSVEGGKSEPLCTINDKTSESGCSGSTTDGYTTNYVDNSVSPGKKYAYTVTAQTGSGSTAASNAATATTPSSAKTITQCQSQPLTSGFYVIPAGSTLHGTVEGQPCLTITGSNVTLECQGATLTNAPGAVTMFVAETSGFLISDCTLSDATSPGQNPLDITDSSSGALVADDFSSPGCAEGCAPEVSLSASNAVAMVGSSLTNLEYNEGSGSEDYVGATSFTNPSGDGYAALIVFMRGWHNVADDNNMDGGDTVQTHQGPPGCDDGFNIDDDDADDVIANNTIAHVYDSGMEPVFASANTLFIGNHISYAYEDGFGMYHGTSLVNDSVIDNTVTHSGRLFYIAATNEFAPGIEADYLLYNAFVGNSVSEPSSTFGEAALLHDSFGTQVSAPAAGNTIADNNFGTGQTAPQINPGASFLGVPAANNVCQETPPKQVTEAGVPIYTLSCPVVSRLSPSSGSVLGGSTITVTGVGFTTNGTANGVTVNGVPATNVHVSSNTSLTATVPPSSDGAVGPATVSVAVPGVSNESLPATASAPSPFTYTAVVPAVTNVSTAGTIFAEGAVAGGTTVTVEGSGFTQGAKVYFGATAGSNVDVLSSNRLTVTSPAGSESTGYVNVTVNTPSGTSPVSEADEFVYGPTVTSFTPTSGPVTGATKVTVTGTGFEADGGIDGAFVDQSGDPGATVKVESPTRMTVTMPESYRGALGSFPLGISIAGVSGQAASGFVFTTTQRFTYTAVVPAVTNVSTAGTIFAEGAVAGGTTVTVEGSGFTQGAKAYFGATAGSSVDVLSSSKLTVTSPAGSESTGYVNVTVNTPSGTSPVSEADQFVYGPTVTSCTPTSGPPSGGTRITIKGTGFNADGGLSTIFTATGLEPLTELLVRSSTELLATLPAAYQGKSGTTALGFDVAGVSGQAHAGYAFLACSFTWT